MKVMSFDVSIEPGWEGSTTPYKVTTTYRNGNTRESRCLDLSAVQNHINSLIDTSVPPILEKYRQIPYEFREQVK